MPFRLRIAALLLFTGLLGGCVQNPSSRPPIDASTSSLDELKSISIEARDELRLLAKAQQSIASKSMTSQQHEQEFFQATYIPPGFEKMVTYRYIGLVDKAAEGIAAIAGYQFIASQNKPVEDIWVNINIQNAPLNEALRELGMQTGSAVKIEVHPAAKLMRLSYNK